MTLSLAKKTKADLLVVDDTPENLQLLTDLLREQGYVVRAALNGELALKAIVQQLPDLILLDIKMPGMDGFEVCTQLKRRPESRDIPIIFIGALSDVQDKVRAFEMGGADCIAKPFQESEVLVRIRTQLHLVEATKALKESEELSRSLLESVAEGIVGVDNEGKATFINPAAAELLGYTAEEIIGHAVHEKIHYAHADGVPYPVKDCPMLRAIHENCSVRVDGEFLWRKSGSCFPVIYNSHPVHINGEVIGAVVSFTDITKLRQNEETLRRLLVTDQLTGIFNRIQLDEVLAAELVRSMRYERSFSLIMMDIDDFKSVNDTYGHLVGDEVLKAMAKILQSRIRATDTLGRWGGEEFMVVCPEIGLEQAAQLAELLRVSIEGTAFPGPGEKTASFGVAAYRKGDTFEILVERADKALYQAKDAGKNRVMLDDNL